MAHRPTPHSYSNSGSTALHQVASDSGSTALRYVAIATAAKPLQKMPHSHDSDDDGDDDGDDDAGERK